MTQKQLYNQIAAFTGDWKSAKEQMKIFIYNALVPIRCIESLSLSFGKFCDVHGNYYGENRDTINFDYTDNEGDRMHFAIMN